ncbi:DUF2017 domain-containing protein [Salinifilum aidingensis]
MEGWTRRNGHVVTRLSQQEAAVIRGLVGQIKDMLTARAAEVPQDELAELTGIRTGPAEPPEDKVLERLLPDFFRTDVADAAAGPGEADENAAAALRSLHEPEVVEAKTEVADLVLNTCPVDGGNVQLTGEQADQWLTALNDVRLALGTALEIGEDGEDDLVDDAETDELRREHLGVYHWLTWVQDSLVTALVE